MLEQRGLEELAIKSIEESEDQEHTFFNLQETRPSNHCLHAKDHLS